MNWRAYLTDPGLAGFVAVEEGNGRILARRGYEEWARAAASGEGEAGAERRLEGGRAAHPLVGLPGGGWAVLRRYRRGGMMRHVNRGRYFLGHRAFDELRVTARAGEAGVRVPEVIAAVELRRGVGYEGLFATRWLEGAVGLERWLLQSGSVARLEALRLTGEQIGRLHAGGIAHPDLNLRNVLVVPADAKESLEVTLIDFDRARAGTAPVPAAERLRELRRLARSARKLGVALGAAEVAALRAGYGTGWPSGLSLE